MHVHTHTHKHKSVYKHAPTNIHTHRMPGIVEPYPKARKKKEKEKKVYIAEPFLNFSTLRSSLDSIAKPIIMVSLCVCQCSKPAPLAGVTLYFLSFFFHYGSQLLNKWRMYSQSRFKSFLQESAASFWMVGGKKWVEDSGGPKNRTKLKKQKQKKQEHSNSKFLVLTNVCWFF